MKNFTFSNDTTTPIQQAPQRLLGSNINSIKIYKANNNRVVLIAAAIASTMMSFEASAATVSTCAGVSLPPSVITNIVGAAVLPLTTTLDGTLSLLLGPLGLNSNLNSTLNSIASGAPINLNVLDSSGNIVAPNAPCQTISDEYTLTTPKGISIGGNKISGIGNGIEANAGEVNSIAFGNGAITDAAATNAIAIGPQAAVGAAGVDSVALGSAASVNVANSVALGAGSQATTGAETNYNAYGLSTPQSSVGEVSVGSIGNTRKITNVAAGSVATDAVNVAQLQAVDDGAVKYDRDINGLILKMSVTLEGPLSIDGGTTGGTKVTNLAKGAVNANSSDAINGSQLFGITQGVSANMDALGLSMATNLGGGAIYNSSTGAVSAPTYNVYGAPQNNVGAAITALQTNAPLQYSNAAGVATPNTPSNDVTLVGSNSGPVTLHNLANGIAPNDAVNKSQLDAVQSNVSNLDALAVKYDAASKDVITFAGPVSNDGGQTGGTTITNLHQGQLSATSTDAVNGAQLYATNQAITNMSNGGGIKYFHTNSTGVDSAAIGVESIAVGASSVATGDGSIAMGNNSQATEAGAIAIGQNASSSGVNSIAIGNGAVATGSVAVGVNAQAGNGGAAFGDDAVALIPQQGTALGNGATVTANRGVAIGAGAQANRAGMNGATEKYSNVSVASVQGAVSVGSLGNERQMTNVAGGTADTDAVNVRQLDAAVSQSNQYTDYQLSGLRSEIGDVKYDANAGTAAAMALASMPQSVLPGKAMMTAGIATYQGQSAVAIGLSNFSENGRWIINLNGTANTRGLAGLGVGVGVHW